MHSLRIVILGAYGMYSIVVKQGPPIIHAPLLGELYV